MLIKLSLDKKNKKIKNEVAPYTPSPEVVEVTKLVMRNWETADTVKNKSYREFNDMSLLQRQSLDQMRFNSYQEPASNDADESWKSRAIRPITRNRSISIAAHLTSSVQHPNVHAQNDNDEADRDAAIVMRDLLEFAGDQSHYEENLVYAIIAALVNPAVVIHTEYCEVWRTIKDWVQEYADGSDEKPKKYKTKEVLDELYSGFQDSIVPLDELWLADFYIRDIQKQPYIIRRRTINYDIAETKYSKYESFKHVKPGVQYMYVDGDKQGQFYMVEDEEIKDQKVEEVIYYDRGRDLQLIFLNGVLICDPEHPNPRQDKSYPFVMFGYEPIDEGKFAFYKSLVNKMGTDEDVIQTLYRMIIDGTYLQLMPPQAVFGDEAVTASVMVPGATTHFESESTKMQVLGTGANLNAGLTVLQKVESSASESSIDPIMAGQSSMMGSKQPSTAYEINQQQQNARAVLGLFGKMIGFAVKAYAELRISDILQYMTIADITQLTSDAETVKFHSFLMPEKSDNGKSVANKIQFDLDLPDEMQTEEYDMRSYSLMNQEEDEGGNIRIYRVNPTLFRNLKFKVRVTADVITPPSDAVKKALNLEAFDRAINLPFTDHEALTRDLLFGSYSRTKDDPDKYMMKKAESPLAEAIGAAPGSNMAQPGSVEGERAMRANNLRQEAQSEALRGGY